MRKYGDRDTMSFHVQLLSKLIDVDQFPFVKLVIENNVSKEEYEELFQLLQMLEQKYEIQKDEGFLDFTSLLIHFAGMVTEKLEPNETIYALSKEGYFPNLMREFKTLVNSGVEIK